MKLISPHISRIFTAGAVWVLLIGLVLLNFSLLTTRPMGYSTSLMNALANPFSVGAHENLAQALWSSGARTFAKQELAIARELSPVLGADSATREEREKRELQYWQDAVVAHPDYRDAYIQLAALSYAQGNLLQTHSYLSQAAALDPNGTTVGTLLEFVSRLLTK